MSTQKYNHDHSEEKKELDYDNLSEKERLKIDYTFLQSDFTDFVKKVGKIYNDGRELQSCVNNGSLSIILNRLESIINENEKLNETEKPQLNIGAVSGSACTGASCCTIDCTQKECSHIAFHKCILSGLRETKATNKIIGTYHLMRPWNWNGYHYPLIDKIKKHIGILKEKKLINEDLSITEVGYAFLADR